MRTRIRITLTCMLLAAGAAAVVARQSSKHPAVLLERAIQLETVDGDLEAAIEQYQQIIADNGHPLECFAVGRDMTFTL